MISISLSKKQLKTRKELGIMGGFFSFVLVILKTQDVKSSLIFGFSVWLFIFLIFLFIDQQKRQTLKKSGIQNVDTMDGFQFEHYLVELFKSHRYSAKKTPDQNDFGADLLLKKDGKKIVVQAKRYKSNVGIQAVQEILGAQAYYKAQEAWVVTNSEYTKSAVALAHKSNVRLLDRNDLIKLQNKSDKTNGNISPAKIKKEVQAKENKPCKKCGGSMVLRNSKKGVFYGCRSFPQCRNIEKA
jgi:restriction system protein